MTEPKLEDMVSGILRIYGFENCLVRQDANGLQISSVVSGKDLMVAVTPPLTFDAVEAACQVLRKIALREATAKAA